MFTFSLGLFLVGLFGASVFEWRWRTAVGIHRLLHMALEAGAPCEEEHDLVTNWWFWLRNMACASNVVAASAFLTGNAGVDWFIILAKVTVTLSLGLSFTRVWLNTRCDRRPKRKKLRARVKEWAKAHRPHLAPARPPAPSPV